MIWRATLTPLDSLLSIRSPDVHGASDARLCRLRISLFGVCKLIMAEAEEVFFLEHSRRNASAAPGTEQPTSSVKLRNPVDAITHINMAIDSNNVLEGLIRMAEVIARYPQLKSLTIVCLQDICAAYVLASMTFGGQPWSETRQNERLFHEHLIRRWRDILQDNVQQTGGEGGERERERDLSGLMVQIKIKGEPVSNSDELTENEQGILDELNRRIGDGDVSEDSPSTYTWRRRMRRLRHAHHKLQWKQLRDSPRWDMQYSRFVDSLGYAISQWGAKWMILK